MKVYRIRDYTGCESTHLAHNFESAIQAHLVHYGLLWLKGTVEQVSIQELKEVKDRSTICWNAQCCLAAAADYPKQASLKGD